MAWNRRPRVPRAPIPIRDPVYLVLPADPSAEARRFLAFLGTAEAAEIVRQAGGIMDLPVSAMTQ